MNNTIKVLITLVIILAVIGFLYNTHSNTLVTDPSLINTISNESNNPSLISPNEAITIANSNIPAYGEVRYGVKLIQNGQSTTMMLSLKKVKIIDTI